MDETGNVLMKKVGPLPLVVWVVGASGVVFLFLLMKGKSTANTAANNQTNQVSALAPTEAEAFGTIEQQQQDVTNALTTLGNNQSALGGSMSTLTGIVTQQGTDNATSFGNLLNGQQTIEQGQTSAASASANYYQSLLANMLNYYNSLSGQVAGVNSNVNGLNSNMGQQYSALSGQIGNSAAANASYYQWLSQQLAGVSGQVSGVSGQVGTVGNQVSGLWGPDMNIVSRLSTLSNQMGYGPGQ